jgi:hypothetical protein
LQIGTLTCCKPAFQLPEILQIDDFKGLAGSVYDPNNSLSKPLRAVFGDSAR